jgi:lipoyl(octanoyl) transferase
MTGGERPPELWVCHLGTVPYELALAAQEHVRTRRQRGEIPDTLLLLEHPPVLTAGRRADQGELPLPAAFYAARGIAVHEVDRGGRITYHGPGQLVGYPIMAIDDVGAYVRTMEAAIVDALAQEGIVARARPDDGPDYTGVWVGARKIASIGVHVQHGVTTHGFAVNVENDLEPFSWIVACGLPDVTMTSLDAERGATDSCEQSLPCFRKRMAHSFCTIHGRRQRLVSPRGLGVVELLAGTPPRPAPEAVPA